MERKSVEPVQKKKKKQSHVHQIHAHFAHLPTSLKEPFFTTPVSREMRMNCGHPSVRCPRYASEVQIHNQPHPEEDDGSVGRTGKEQSTDSLAYLFAQSNTVQRGFAALHPGIECLDPARVPPEYESPGPVGYHQDPSAPAHLLAAHAWKGTISVAAKRLGKGIRRCHGFFLRTEWWMVMGQSWFLPCVDGVPEPLGAVAHGDPVARELGRGLLPAQGRELPEMLVP